MEGLDGVGIPLESPKLALLQRKGGFLLSERWLAQNGTLAFFARTTQQALLFVVHGITVELRVAKRDIRPCHDGLILVIMK